MAAGLEDCLQFLQDFSFTPQDLDYLRRTQEYGEDTLRAFAALRFTGEVRAVPEGRVVFTGELCVPRISSMALASRVALPVVWP